jgi:hypothetical protein
MCTHGTTREEPDCAFVKDESGGIAIEYGLIAAGIFRLRSSRWSTASAATCTPVHLDQPLAKIGESDRRFSRAPVIRAFVVSVG